ncbi:Stk1 family PASTA domain-containing Ser/Thr kinase [Arcanobacterium hippocoleae]|uniref:non-specific serine/threonine protein kinase n=1 Tax=Arcanobacterium hippocoleae TaxID=149017 RepID=A0ABU1T0H5_9ACTO|nr:Stk1 family PASTA domain-containing Ser/Thr kinase [Arcanobacterium hippocoleae]MDR6938874.1 serine/threonine-protein kinase [Arcanobacterium hippocoleae]
MNNLDSLIGKLIDGRYLINARIARGGMASVYRATDQRLGRDVAMKIIHPHLAEHADFTNRFIQEARSAAALSNAHIVNVHDQGIALTPDGDRAYLVMELITGPNLRRSLNENGSFSLGSTLEIARQTLIALAAAHSKGYVHRDVKPENILLTTALHNSNLTFRDSIDAKVADFGLARAAASSTGMQTSSLLGTIAYIAPEIVSREKVTPAADIYAVGIMIYELLAGKLPYSGESPLAVAYAHVNEPVPRLSDDVSWMPPAIDSLIALFTAKDPLKRPQHGTAALDVLEDICQSLSPEVLLRRIPIFPVKNVTTAVHTQRIEENSTSPVSNTLNPGDNHAPRQTEKLSALNQNSHSGSDIDPNTSYDPDPNETSNSSIINSTAVIPHDQLPDPNTAMVIDHANYQQEDTLEQTPAKRSRRRLGRIFGSLILLALLVSGGYWYFTAGPGLRITIPAVQSLNQQEAQKKLEQAGFTVSLEHEFSDTIAKDNVIGTKPESGKKIHPSTKIKLLISDGIEHHEVPNVIGKTIAEASLLLTEQTFHPESSEAWSEDVAQGLVMSQDPPAGTAIPHDSTVKITISKGREPLSVPKLTGTKISDATATLSTLGFKLEVTEEFSDDIEKGTVITQDVPEGETRYRNDVIKLVVSKGPELVPVPNVVGQQEKSARQVLERAGFKVEVDRILGGFFGTVRLQTPGAGEKVKAGSTVKLSIV